MMESDPSRSPLKDPTRLLFIHHSCGGQWLAEPGPVQSLAPCIRGTHPNGGGLRQLLQECGFEVHEASYGSEIGDRTDLFDWLAKFRDKMDKILALDFNDRLYADGRKNQVVVFKSCFPNSAFVGKGDPPGNPAGPELTLWNVKAALKAVLSEFEKHPDVLFIYVSAPPLAPKVRKGPLWKRVVKRVLGKPTEGEKLGRSSALCREFNDWMKSPWGWLEGHSLENVAVFDLFDVLTDHGASDGSRYPTGDGYDPHPSRAGNQKAAEEFVPFLKQAVRRIEDRQALR